MEKDFENMNAEEMAIAIYECFYTAAETGAECYKTEYTKIAIKSSLAHVKILTKFINVSIEENKYWETVKSNIQLKDI